MDKALVELIRISNVTGRDSRLVVGGGGNTSVKTDDGKYMYIKASGTSLKDMNPGLGWRRLRLSAVLEVMRDKQLAKMDENTREAEIIHRLLLSCDDSVKIQSRPSVEAHLHAMLDKCVIHLHPLVVAAYVNARNGKASVEKLFQKEKYPPLWIPYADPGFFLARTISRLIRNYEKKYDRKPSVMVLGKHGLIVSAQSSEAALRLVRKTIRIFEQSLTTPKLSKLKQPAPQDIASARLDIRRAVFDVTGQYLPVSHFLDETITAFMSRKNAGKLLAVATLNPDELVYANGSALWLDNHNPQLIARKLRALVARGLKPSRAFLVKGLGLFVAADKKSAPLVAEITTGSLWVRTMAEKFGGVVGLNRRQQHFINNWEAEAFRKSLVSTSSAGEICGRIAVVTGAGSGLGRSIAQGLAHAGALVAVADIDTQAAQETVSLIKKEIPDGMALPVLCDVTDPESVEQSFHDLLAQWGGLDIVVNAAGVAPAFPLVDLPVDKWRFALEVNLTGYFLMAQMAARIMIQQGMGGSIINISSKSGLDASKNNTPYNATKAGELHMARGWAMELGEYGIRVNCVCPGNVFEGSKIWNPQYIKICAKKYGIKPEEVIPYYVDKTVLRREIKGQDIADAVVFLASDKARTVTGQIIVADSGQVMVR